MIYGSRTALLVGFAASFAGLRRIGAVLGVLSAYFGGRIDLCIQRVMDIFLAFPLIILALALVASNPGGTDAERDHRHHDPDHPALRARGARRALAIREMPYVDAARAAGFGHTRIILRHMAAQRDGALPDHADGASSAQAILAEASLSFLGLGVQEPTAAWGLMLRGGAEEFCRDGALDGDLPGRRDQPGGVRLQPVRRLAARRARPAPQDAVAQCHFPRRAELDTNSKWPPRYKLQVWPAWKMRAAARTISGGARCPM